MFCWITSSQYSDRWCWGNRGQYVKLRLVLECISLAGVHKECECEAAVGKTLQELHHLEMLVDNSEWGTELFGRSCVLHCMIALLLAVLGNSRQHVQLSNLLTYGM